MFNNKEKSRFTSILAAGAFALAPIAGKAEAQTATPVHGIDIIETIGRAPYATNRDLAYSPECLREAAALMIRAANGLPSGVTADALTESFVADARRRYAQSTQADTTLEPNTNIIGMTWRQPGTAPCSGAGADGRAIGVTGDGPRLSRTGRVFRRYIPNVDPEDYPRLTNLPSDSVVSRIRYMENGQEIMTPYVAYYVYSYECNNWTLIEIKHEPIPAPATQATLAQTEAPTHTTEDLCPNIEGVQSALPPNMRIRNGVCEVRDSNTGAWIALGIGVAALLAILGGRDNNGGGGHPLDDRPGRGY